MALRYYHGQHTEAYDFDVGVAGDIADSTFCSVN